MIKFPLILREAAAIGFRFSHASLEELRFLGRMLSNTSLICPMLRNNLGNLRIIPDRENFLEWCFLERLPA